MTYAYPATYIRSHMADILEKLREEGSSCLVTQKGRATAALVPMELYNQMISDLEDWMDEQDKSLAKEVRQARKEYKSRKFKTLGQLRR